MPEDQAPFEHDDGLRPELRASLSAPGLTEVEVPAEWLPGPICFEHAGRLWVRVAVTNGRAWLRPIGATNDLERQTSRLRLIDNRSARRDRFAAIHDLLAELALAADEVDAARDEVVCGGIPREDHLRATRDMLRRAVEGLAAKIKEMEE